jgi:formamidopyrimidine-DNA glycosylase
MPEAPEVEAVARTLRPLLVGRKIRSVQIRHAIAIRPQGSRTIKKHLVGARLQGVERRGKYLLLPLDRGCIVMHFKFDGQVLWFDRLKDALARDVHVDAAFETDAGTLGFVDPRHLGRVQWFAQPADSPGIRVLGVDVFSREFTPQYLSQLCSESRQPLKTLLMNQ